MCAEICLFKIALLFSFQDNILSAVFFNGDLSWNVKMSYVISCEECDTNFYEDKYFQHQLEIHGRTNEQMTQQRQKLRFTCQNCERKYQSKCAFNGQYGIVIVRCHHHNCLLSPSCFVGHFCHHCFFLSPMLIIFVPRHRHCSSVMV